MNMPTKTPNNPPLKPGFKTTEFWLTLGTFLVSGFVLTGVISQTNQDTVGQIVAHAITSVSLVAGQAAIVYKYISGRNKKKNNTKVEKEEIKEEEKLPEKPKPKRTIKRKRKKP